MTPADLWTMANETARIERERDKSEWRRTAWLAAQIINISGKAMPKGRTVRAEDLIKFRDDDIAAGKVDMEKRRREAEESFRLAKRKFWTKIKGDKLDDIVIPGVTAEEAMAKEDDGERIKRFILGK